MKQKLCLLAIVAICSFSGFAQDDSLSRYMTHIKAAYNKGSAETGMGTIGYEMVYGIDHFNAKGYDYASWRFETVLQKDPAHPYANYLLGLCQLSMGKEALGKASLNKAVELLPALKDRLDSDIATYSKKPATKATVKTANNKDTQPVKKVGKPAAEKLGGSLVYGNYACHYMQYQGAGALVAYKAVYKGYFKLNADGTYRWLDNGETGKYRYDAATGKITWLSGYFTKSKPLSSVYKPGEKVASIDLQMEKNYFWGCGCNK
jgi:hypothetical protein